MSDPAAAPPPQRLPGIDLVRGLVMVLMALDHVRDYFGDVRLNPEAMATTTPLLFATRWVTHFCAPVFVLLAGVSARLAGARRSKAALSRFLVARGLWLIALEFTVVYWAWMFSFELGFVFVQVIAAIGFGMLVLAATLHLPNAVGIALGLLLVAGHNLLDGSDVRTSTDLGRLFFGGFQMIRVDGTPRLLVIYALAPWAGVMLLGYGLGALFQRERGERRRLLLVSGLVAMALFVVLRATGAYGDPVPFTEQRAVLDEAGRSSLALQIAAFLNCAKYPPSLCYLLMTLGPALVLLAAVDREPGRLGELLVVYGRVPLFYYVVHLLLIHLGAALLYLSLHGVFLRPMLSAFRGEFPPWFGGGLGTVYVAWFAVVSALYPACRWYAGVKRRGRSPVWSYL